uniref:Nucleolar protein 6 n=1 Tax=Ascaris suum TaxID=6253 RepID=F1KTM6_ASCSU
MQIDAYISEKQLSDHERKEYRELASRITAYVAQLGEAQTQHDVWDTSELTKAGIEFPFHLPFGRKLSDVSSSRGCQWIAPECILQLSDHALGLATKMDPALDMEVIIPQKYFGSRDFLNFAYHVKRAQYACHLAAELRAYNCVVRFATEEGDRYRPILIVTKDDATLRFHFSPPDGFAKPNRFRPSNNNLRSLFCLGAEGAIDSDPPTPYYNASILSDLVRRQLDSIFKKFLEDKPNFVKAIFMIRAWMQTRFFTKRRDGFSNTLITAWILHLYRKGFVSRWSGVVGIIEAFFTSIVSTNWKDARLALVENIDESTFKQFTDHFNFVFLDETGYLNLARALSVTAWDNIRDAAASSFNKLVNFNDFDPLFTIERPFELSFDLYIKVRIRKDIVLERLRRTQLKELISRCNDWSGIALDRITSLMKKAWTGRASLFDIDIQMGCFGDERNSDSDLQALLLANSGIPSFGLPEQWDLSSKPVDVESMDVHLTLGVRLMAGWESSITRGSPAKLPEADDFRQFWGEVSELRKFPDNAICEAVVWDEHANSPRVPFQICQHILSRHMNLTAECFEERSVFDDGILPCVTERYEVITNAFEKLSRKLRAVHDLPLLITSINPVSCFLRRTSPYPPPPSDCVVDASSSKVVDRIAFPLRSACPPYLPTVEVHLTMEHSGKWGEDLDAIAHLKTAFYSELCKILNEKFSMHAYPYEKHAIVLLDGVVFRLLISYSKEVHIMRKLAAPKGGQLRDTVETKLKERELILQPSLAAHLYSVSEQFPAFAPACRLALKWLSSQMLSQFIDSIMVETIMADVFLRPFTGYQPRTPFMGFAHFLRLLSSHNWLLRPLLVDFTNEWNADDIYTMQKDFAKMRPVLPPMVVCVPEDRTGCSWTRDEPQAVILKRIMKLASNALMLIRWNISFAKPINLRAVFTASEMRFDGWIYLRGKYLVRRKTLKRNPVSDVLPVYDYDPVGNYLSKVRAAFNSFAIFFHDKYNGARIGVVWKPDALKPKDSNISSCMYRYLNEESGMMQMDKESIREDLVLLGRGIVRKVVFSDE